MTTSSLLHVPGSSTIRQAAGSYPLSADWPDQRVEAAAAYRQAGVRVYPFPRTLEPEKWLSYPYPPLPGKSLSELAAHPEALLLGVTGQESGNLMVIECGEGQPFKEQGDQLAARGIPRWGGTAHPGESGYYLLRIKEGEVENHEDGALKVWGHSHLHPLPPSVDGAGCRHVWVYQEGSSPPVVSIADLGWLGVKLRRQPIPIEYRGPYGTLCAHTRQVIAVGAASSNKLFDAACDIAGCGFEQAKAERWLSRNPAAQLMERLDSVLQAAYSEPRWPAALHEWQYALARLMSFEWPNPRTQSTDVAVGVALCWRARADAEAGIFRAAQRELSLLAGVTPVTVRRALVRLQKYGIVKRVNPARRRSTRIRFRKPFLRTDEPLTLYPITRLTTKDNGLIFGHDAAHPSALGKTGILVWRQLGASDRPMKRAELARACNLTGNQVSYALPRLRESGVVEPGENRGWWRLVVEPTDANLDDIAELAGVAGRARRMHARYERERILRAEHDLRMLFMYASVHGASTG